MADTGALYLLDGNSLVFRAFFALPIDLATKAGQVTNAVHGFTSMLVDAAARQRAERHRRSPSTGPSRRFETTSSRSTRATAPRRPISSSRSSPWCAQVLGALGMVTVEAPGYEADDILATLATQARDAGRDVVIVTGDRDAFQLVEDPHVNVMYTRRGISDTVVYDEAGITERYGVPPQSYAALASLRGDTSDNLPGVPGVGEKTAAKLVSAYGDLDGIFDHLAEQTPKLRQNLADHEDAGAAQRRGDPPRARRRARPSASTTWPSAGGTRAEVKRVFGELELRSLWQRLAPLLGGDADEALPRAAGVAAPPEVDLDAVHARVPATPAEAAGAIDELRGAGAPVSVAAVWSGVAGRSPLGVGLGPSGERRPRRRRPPVARRRRVRRRRRARRLPRPGGSGGPADRGPRVQGADAHAAARGDRHRGPGARHRRGGVPARPVLGPLPPRGRGGGAARPGARRRRRGGCVGTPGPRRRHRGGHGHDRGAHAAVSLGLLYAPMREALHRTGLERLHDEVERPLVRVLARMEVAGIRVDAAELRRIADGLVAECARLEAEIHELAGETFNVNSTPQLRTVLYDRLGLTPGRKTKTGFSTDAATLRGLRGQHPIVDTLLALPRSGEAALDLRRDAAVRGR